MYAMLKAQCAEWSNDPRTMKSKLIVLTATALAVGFSAWLAVADLTNVHDPLLELAYAHTKAMQADGSITNVINLLATSREFCRIRGHAWGPHLHVTLEYVPDRIACRECKICGLHQSQMATEWK